MANNMESKDVLSKTENTNYLRIVLLMVDVGTERLLHLFYKHIPKSTVRSFFASKKLEIDDGYKKNIFDKAQYAKLICNDLNADELDLSLLIKLLLYFKLESTLSVDINNLRIIRNDIQHMSKATSEKLAFDRLWSAVEIILCRIGKCISEEEDKETKEKVEELKCKVLELSDRDVKIIKAFEIQYKKDVGILRENAFEEQMDVENLQENVTEDIIHLSMESNNQKMEGSQHPISKKDVQDGCRKDIMLLYRLYQTPLTLWEDHHDIASSDMYVEPPMYSIDYNKVQNNSKEKTPIKSFSEIFGSKLCQNIFIISAPGCGKTTFCRRLMLLWCQAHRPDQEVYYKFNEKDIAMMKQFDFLFFVPLRNFKTTNSCIDDMIQVEVLNRIGQTDSNFLHDVLSERNCLIILDGLDEYTPLDQNIFKYGIPSLREASNACIVMTTRPWKLYALGLKTSQIDRLIEICRFEDFQSYVLIGNVIANLNRRNELNKKRDDFKKAILQCIRQDIVSVPIMLMQLICLWYENKLGNSQCQTYANMLELLFRRSSATLEQSTIEQYSTEFHIPTCFSHETEHCRTSIKLLCQLGHLAFDTLFNAHQESSLVFDASLVNSYLSDMEINKCLQIGVLSQNKVSGMVSSRWTAEFLHKTFQEFLSALYISISKENEQLQLMDTVVSSTGSVQKILEASEILIFLSGMCPTIMSKISVSIGEIVNKSELTRQHRESFRNYLFLRNWKTVSLSNHPLKLLQDLFVSCVSESKANEYDFPEIPLQDAFYFGDESRHYMTFFQHLIDRCARNIKSLCVFADNIVLHKVVLAHLSNLECLYFCIKLNIINLPREMEAVMSRSLSTLKLLGIQGVILPDTYVSVLKQCQHLRSLELFSVELSHKLMEDLMLFLSQRTDLIEISLSLIYCSAHPVDFEELKKTHTAYENPSCLHRLNLTRHKLVDLRLVYVGFSHLSVNTCELKNCELVGISHAAVSAVLKETSHLQNLEHLSCQCMWSSKTVELVAATVPTLVNLSSIILSEVDIGNKSIVFSDKMAKLDNVNLQNISVTLSALLKLVNSLARIRHEIYVCICNCNLSSQNSVNFYHPFERISLWNDFKKKICNSTRFVVPFGGLLHEAQLIFHTNTD